jgi:hypothetical protein
VPADQRERAGHPERGQRLGAGPAAGLAGDECGEDRGCSDDERARDPDRPQVVAEDVDAEAGQQRGERRLVDEAPGEVVPEYTEIKLIAVIVVAAGEREQDGDDGERDQPDGPPRERRTLRLVDPLTVDQMSRR